ncbi:hypothetical protein BDZ91DRAFT_800365 [Kalaharituber pfeilii]|nr:hypothetical protein BDZ91DRAFT_800365 [Kalaharituber pfeilii]
MLPSTLRHCSCSFSLSLQLTFPLLIIFSLFTPPTVSEAVPFADLTLRETPYNSNISHPPSTVLSVLTLPEFLRQRVAPSGTPVAPNNDAEMLAKHYSRGFGWNEEEDEKDADAGWVPAGLSTWEDAAPKLSENEDGWDGDGAAKDTVVVSWRQKNNAGVRVTFVTNATSTAENMVKKYTHVYLISLDRSSSDSDKLELRPSSITTGILAFDLSHIWQVNPSSSPHNAAYVLPHARSYVPSARDGRLPSPFRAFKFSFLALDRSTEGVNADRSPALLAGEWETLLTGATYLAKWPFSATSGRLRTTSVEIGSGESQQIAAATWAWRINIVRVRGIAYSPVQKRYFLAQTPLLDQNSKEDRPAGNFDVPADLIPWIPGSNSASYDGSLARGVAALAYVRDQDELWMVGTSEGARGVVGVDMEKYSPRKSSSPSSTETSGPTATQTDSSQTTTAVASTDDPGSSSSSSGTNKSAIAGGVVGGVLGTFAIVAAAFFLRRRQRRDGVDRSLDPTNGSAVMGSAYPPNGFRSAQPGDDFGPLGADRGEIPMIKPELEATEAAGGGGGYTGGYVGKYPTTDRDPEKAKEIGGDERWELASPTTPPSPTANPLVSPVTPVTPGPVPAVTVARTGTPASTSTTATKDMPARKPVPGSPGSPAEPPEGGYRYPPGARGTVFAELPAVEPQAEQDVETKQ